MNYRVLYSAVLFMVFLMAASSAAAQTTPITRGELYLSGGMTASNAGGELYEIYGNRQTSCQFSASSGLFMARGLAVGAKAFLTGYTHGESYRSTTWCIGPMVVYFFGGREGATLRKSCYPYVGCSALYGRQKLRERVSEPFEGWVIETTTTVDTKIALGGGVAFMVTERAALLMDLSYQVDSSKISDQDPRQGILYNILVGLAIFL